MLLLLLSIKLVGIETLSISNFHSFVHFRSIFVHMLILSQKECVHGKDSLFYSILYRSLVLYYYYIIICIYYLLVFIYLPRTICDLLHATLRFLHKKSSKMTTLKNDVPLLTTD